MWIEDSQMQSEISTVAPALKALLERFIDYAGLFPPAKLSLDDALANYERYRTSPEAWMLRWFVIDAPRLEGVPESFDGCLSVLANKDSSRAATLETKSVLSAKKPVYCEVPVERFDEVKSASNFAKIRMGGLTANAIPSTAESARFILACAERRLPFKATAGLHHPIRAEYRLTYKPDSAKAFMHGFLNVLMASAFAWHGERQIEPILSETDPTSFRFDQKAHWKDLSLDEEQIRQARERFIHSVGSCSFEEPVQDLKSLDLL